MENTNHSENKFSEDFLLLSDSGAGIIHVRAKEVLRAVSCLRKTIILDKSEYREWDIVNGNRTFTIDTISDESVAGDGNIDFTNSFQIPLSAIRGQLQSIKNTLYFVYVNPHPFMESPYINQLLLIYNECLPSCRTCVVLVTPDISLPESEANDSILSITFLTPNIEELHEIFIKAINYSRYKETFDLLKQDIKKICNFGAGMTALQFETYVSLATVKSSSNKKEKITTDSIITEVQKGKTEIVNSNDLLELYPTEDISNIGGCNNLKNWIKKRSICFSQDAEKFGIEKPKGIILTGIPGTGKSSIAKAVASVFNVPLIKMDFGKMFSSLVGSSEERIRTALSMLERLGRIVCLIEEIDKALGGIINSHGGDSGVSQRVLGTFLTWLQDTRTPAFIVATANSIEGLPPELLRRGRFDAIFATDLPTYDERREIFDIHLRKRGRNILIFSEDEIDRLIAASNNYVPAEIESAIKDALINAYSDGKQLSVQYMISALKEIIPLSKSFAPQLEKITEWTKINAIPVSSAKEKSIFIKDRIRIRGNERIQ